jgi:alpha-beta hydrolase superfamily lysophospholipase
MAIVKQFVPHNMAVLAFDFAGCGMSTGDYISLGWFERHDTELILTKLKALFPQITDIVLWGRSMGSVTALLYSGHNPYAPYVKGLVLDSPFSDLKTLSLELI